MTIIRSTRARRALPAAVAVLALSLAACSGGDGSSDVGDVAEGDVEAALQDGGELLVWGWDATLPATVAAFEDAYPNVSVNLVNVGTTTDEYTAIENAIAAGSGVPDVAHIEYSAIAQFAIGEALTDLRAFGADQLSDEFTDSTWGAVTMGTDSVYALPLDSGPAALFYNEAVFTQYGIDVPTTWDEYREAGRALQAANPDVYVGADTGDAGYAQTMIWQAGGRPFQVDGENVTIDLADEGSTTYSAYWQSMLDEGLLAPITGWTDEWYQGLGDGTIATLVIGAWMPAMLEAGVPGAAGDWRVAPMPAWQAGDTTTAENGGSALGVLDASQNKLLAYGFVEFANAGPGVQVRLDAGTFPATTADLESEEFLNKEFEYFGGQRVNEVLAESAGNVATGWSYLPYQSYAVSIFNDHVGPAYTSGASLADGLRSWQDALVSYGNEQGFTVNGG